MKLNSAPHLLIDLPSRYSIYKRVFLLALTLVIASGSLYVWLSSHLSMNTHYYAQATNIGQGMVRQYQQILTEHVATKNFSRVNTVLEASIQDPHIISASVYDEFGRVIAQKPQYQDFVKLHHANSPNTPLTFVREFYRNNDKGQPQKIGYLRLVMDAKMAEANIAKMEQAFLSRTLVIMFLALMVGVILTRSFYKWRMKSLKIKSVKKR